MHIHHNPMTSGNAGIHSAAAAEAAQRADETRLKLLKNAAHLDGKLDAGELFMVGKWLDGSTGQRERQPPPRQQGAQTAEDESAVKAISLWA